MLEKGTKNRLFVLKTGYNDFLMDYVENLRAKFGCTIKKMFRIGIDYFYYGQNNFIGVHTGDRLQTNIKEKNAIILERNSHNMSNIYKQFIRQDKDCLWLNIRRL